MQQSNRTVYWYIYNHRHMGYVFRLYRVIFRPSKTTDPILQGSQVHCGIPNAYIVVIVTKHWYIYNHRYMGYMFRLYRVIFRPSKTTDPNSQGSQVHCGIPNAYIVVIVTKHWYIYNHRYMGYMFRLYRVIFRPSKTTDLILQGSQVHCGIPNAYIVVIVTKHWHIYNHRYMGYMFRLYRVIFRPSKTRDPILQGSQVHCGIPNAYIVVIATKHWGSHSALDYLVKLDL